VKSGKTMNNSSVRLTFYGAASEVTGSKYLVESDKHKILVDCGLFQGRKDLRLLNWEPPKFNVRELDAILITHAHIDHTGYLPAVVKHGYRGPIYCTPATKELVEMMLLDSAHLQEEEALFANRHGSSKHHPAKPLYDTEDARKTIELLRTMERDKPNPVLEGVTVTPRCAGHILGATSLTLDIGGKRITFSGDIGRYDVPILPDPAPVEIGDLLLCESTYGGKLHSATDQLTELEAIVKTAITRGGPLLIPAFAVGRAQNLLYYLGQLERAGRIPELPVFVDSPMAVNATEIYKRYKHDFDEESQLMLRGGNFPLTTARTRFFRTVDESKSLNAAIGPKIIISASGMATGGRILHHLKRWLPEETSTVLLVGYQAEGTRGSSLLAGEKELKIHGAYVAVRAKMETMSSLSAHGDYSELIRWLKSSTGTPSQIKIVHGERESGNAFVGHLKESLNWNASVAQYLETVEV